MPLTTMPLIFVIINVLWHATHSNCIELPEHAQKANVSVIITIIRFREPANIGGGYRATIESMQMLKDETQTSQKKKNNTQPDKR